MRPAQARFSRHAAVLIVATLLLAATASPAPAGGPPSRALPSWPIIMTEDFEGSFPPVGWSAYDEDGLTNGEAYWDRESCRHHGGSHSAWAAGGGKDGSALTCANYYPMGSASADWVSWLVYGPFDLSGYADAELEFWYWNTSENSFDFFSWMASGDGAAWAGGGQHAGLSGGGASAVWVQQTLDLGAWAGDRSVWIAFRFNSDDEKNWVGGAFVDDVVLRALPAASFRSVAANDGWILERSEDSGEGGTLNTDAVTCRAGDNAADRQFRSILDFQTRELPDDAQILSAVIEIREAGWTGFSSPSTHGKLVADIRTGSFRNSMALETGDFEAKATMTRAGIFDLMTPDGWYRAPLRADALPLINPTGRTQFRVRFLADDDDDGSADYLSFNCGDSLPASRRPVLRITYLVP